MRSARALRTRQSGRRGIRATFELLDLSHQLCAHAQQGIEQLRARAFGGWSREDGFCMLETGVPAQGDVAKTEHREQADACFYAASTEYSEHRCIVGRTRRLGPNCCGSGRPRHICAAKEHEAAVSPQLVALPGQERCMRDGEQGKARVMCSHGLF